MAIKLIADYFCFSENNTNLKIENLAGITTFITMSYIIFVQPEILGAVLDYDPIHYMVYLNLIPFFH